jgi:hypothetical protein
MKPTPIINENPDIHIGSHGWGTEDWLNRADWVLEGYNGAEGDDWRYMNLPSFYSNNFDGIIKKLPEGETGDLYLFSRKNGAWGLSGCIKNYEVISAEEATWAMHQFIDRGWLATMITETKSLVAKHGGIPMTLESVIKDPQNFFCFKFQRNNLIFFPGHYPINYRFKRYSSAHKINIKSKVNKKVLRKIDEELSERNIQRPSISAQTVEPRQNIIQNRLKRALEDIFPGIIVRLEQNNVDLKFRLKGDKKATFVEVKCEDSARQSIRLSIGQLLEYAYYPDKNLTDNFLIVGTEPTHDADRQYLSHLNEILGTNFRYLSWPDELEGLTDKQKKQLHRFLPNRERLFLDLKPPKKSSKSPN